MAGGKYSGTRITGPPAEAGGERMPEERAEILEWLKKVKFRRRIFGGVDERNVWKKITELDALYTKALEAERVRCNVLIKEAKCTGPPGQERQPEGGGDPSG